MANGRKKQKAIRLIGFGIFGLLVSVLGLAPFVAHAQFTIDSNIPSIFGIMNATDLVSTIIAVVQWILAITGLIAVIVIMYGGFVWMTARGDAEKVRKAKKILVNAVIGLAVILLAWVIVYFVADFVTSSTGGGSGSCSIGSYVDCQECVDDGSGNGVWQANNSAPSCPNLPQAHYQVRWEDPKDGTTDVKLCAAVQAGFDGLSNNALDANSVTNDSVRITDSGGTNVALTPRFDVAADSNAFGYKHDTEWKPNETYTVEINNITSSDKVQNSSNPPVQADNYSWSFTTGTESDDVPPYVNAWSPTGAAVCLTPQIQVQFNEPMYAPSISKDNITISPLNPADLEVTNVFMDSSSSFSATLNKPLLGNTTYTITLSAVAPDGFQDSCGNLLDCGNTPNQCVHDGTATGDAADNFVWTFTTDDTTKTDCRPEISSITHTGSYSSNGADAITLAGKNFGINFDTVNFSNKYWGTTIDAKDNTGVNSRCFNTDALPNTGGANPSVACIQSWANTQIKTIVPAGGGALGELGSGATRGNVTVRTGGSSQYVSDPNGDFVDQNNPHIARLYPTSGGVGQFVTISGEKFTNTPEAVYLRKGNYEVQAQTCDPSAWHDNQIVIEIPDDSNFNVGDEILVQVDLDPSAPNDGRDRSNLQKFVLTNDPPSPGLCTITPSCNETAGQTVALTGKYLSGVTNAYYQATQEHSPTIYNAASVTNVTDTTVDATSSNTLPNDTFMLSVDALGNVSNALRYQVPCAAGPEVVFQNSCNLSAVPPVTPSPNPYSDTQDVCVNLASIGVHYSEAMELADIQQSSVSLNQCTGDKTGCTTRIGPTTSNITDNKDASYSQWGGDLDADTWYQFVVPGSARSVATGARIGDDVVWYFKTRADATPCEADQLAISATDADGAAPLYVDATSTTDHPNTIQYQGNTYTNSCQQVTSTGDYTWDVSDTTIADCTGGNCGTPSNPNNPTNQQLVDTKQKDGTTIISAVTGTLSATRQLRVHLNYCQKNSDCTKTIDIDGTPTNCISTCNLAEQRCEPNTISLNPANGPESTITTLRGCYYGPTQGKVWFDNTQASYVCGPATWNPDGTEIKVAVPSGFSIGDIPQVTVETTTPLTSNALPFTVNGLCSNGQPLPSTGVPPGLCSISPPSNIEGESETLRGVGLPDGTGGNDSIQFTGVPPLQSGITWTSDLEATTTVPSLAQTGDVIVNSTGTDGNVCPSNPVQFTVTCNSNNQCGTGCCQNHECVSSGLCAVSAIGAACKIDDVAFDPDPYCNEGDTDPFSINGKEYRCMSDTGSSGVTPVKIENPQGSLCVFCCDPDQDGDPTTTDPQTFVDTATGANLTCVKVPPGAGTCSSSATGTGRGLFCGCTSDAQCGTGNGCSSQNDPTGQRCCRPRPGSPTLVTTDPIQCLNSAIVLEWQTPMNKASINSTTVQFAQLSPLPQETISGSYTVNGSQLIFQPDVPLTPDALVGITISTGVKDFYGISPEANSGFTINVASDAQICKISSVKFDWSTAVQTNMNPPGLFTCAQPGGCVGDIDTVPPNTNGNQNDYYATAVDQFGNPLGGPITYHWDEQDSSDVFQIDASCPNDTVAPFACAITSRPRNGTGSVKVTASDSDSNDAFDYGSKSATADITTFLCERPWPDPYTNLFPYQDSSYNASQSPPWDFHFSMAYCRSDGDLPDLHIGPIQGGIQAPLVDSRNVTPNNGVDELLRQYAFFVTDDTGNRVGSDAIGIRVMENELNLPPDLWYKRVVGEDPHGQSTTVDGFPAMRVGRSTYIAMTNIDGAVMYPNMFIMSYSDNATSKTVEIYNQLLKNIQFNTNSAQEDLASIRNDVKRVQDLNRIGLALSDYKKLNGNYPDMVSGSYIGGFTTSVWPSWLDTFAKNIKMTPPKDPQNFIAMCPLAYRSVDIARGVFSDQNPSGVALDGSGNLYIANWGGTTRTLKKCNAQVQGCTDVYTYNPVQDHPTGVAIDKSNGDVLVAVAGQSGRVDRFDPNNFTAPKASYPISNVTFVDTDSDGNLYVTRINEDNGIYKYTPDGTGPVASRDDDTAGSCADNVSPCPQQIYVDDAAGEIYAADENTGQVKVYNMDLTSTLRTFDGLTSPVGLSKIGDKIFVTEHFVSQRIVELDKDLTTIRNVASNATIQHPYGIVATQNGFIFANYAAHSVDTYEYNSSSATTCWDDNARTFDASSGSRLYSYSYNSNEPILYTNLEYLGPGTWRNIPQDTDACTTFGNGNTCPTFNYQWGSGAFETWMQTYQLSGAPDTVPPTINAFTVSSPITGSVTLTVDASDTGGSGIGYAQFYINDQLKYTTPDSNLTWTFNPSSYLDGSYTFKVRVYDNAGNAAESPDQTAQIAKAVTDQNAPVLSGLTFTPVSAGNTVQGTINLTVTATDNQSNDSGIARVEYYLGTTFIGSCVAGDPCEAANYQVSWDTTTRDDGTYPMYAVAYDNAGNTAFIKSDIDLKNGVDTQAPSVFITNPTGGTVSGIVQVSAQAADNQGVASVQFELSLDAGVTWYLWPASPSFPNPDSTAPYSWSWDTHYVATTVPITNGATVQMRVTATDVNGLTNSTTKDVVVNNTGVSAPSAWFIEPTDGQFYQPGFFKVFATDNKGIASVDVYAYPCGNFSCESDKFLVGSQSVGNPYQVSWNPPIGQVNPQTGQVTTKIQDWDGVYGLRAIAHNNDGLTSDPNTPGASIIVTIDKTPPVITDFAPPDNTTVSGTVDFTVNATDLHGIKQSGVYVWSGGAAGHYVGSDCIPGAPVSPYTCSVQWNTLLNPKVDDGSYWFIGYAIDVAGNVGSLAHQNMNVENNSGPIPGPDVTPPSDPSINFNPPLTNNWAKGTETITASSIDAESGIQYVDILIDGVLQDDNADGHTCTSSPCNWTWDTTTAAIGQHTISAGAIDNAGNVSNTITLPVGVDNVVPMIFLQAPVDNVYVAGTITVLAPVTDGASPPASGIASGEFYLDDPNNAANLIGQDLAAPFSSISWDTTKVVDGDYQLYGVVLDAAGNRSVTPPRTIHIYNADPSLICGKLLCGGAATSCCSNNACYDPAVSQCCNGSVIPQGQVCNIAAPK